jgi:general stress protein 26
MANATDKNRDTSVSTQKKLDDLYDLIDGIEIAMLTTRRPDGSLVSRPMATQRRTSGTDLWFMTDIETHKLDEIAHDNHVNVAYHKPRSGEWVSVSGTAILTRDKQLIHDLYSADWRAWLGDEGGERDGGPDDPRICLILVEATKVVYAKRDRPMPLVLWEIAKGIVTGSVPHIADVREVGARELQKAVERPELH